MARKNHIKSLITFVRAIQPNSVLVINTDRGHDLVRQIESQKELCQLLKMNNIIPIILSNNVQIKSISDDDLKMFGLVRDPSLVSVTETTKH